MKIKILGSGASFGSPLAYGRNGNIDTNNRVIPEFRWFHGDHSVNILYTNSNNSPSETVPQDSVYYRTADTSILNYNLDDTCEMICQMQMQ